jgi:hypothetical protein
VRGSAPRRNPEKKGATAVKPWGSTEDDKERSVLKMEGVNAVLDILAGLGQLVVTLMVAYVLFKMSKFIDSLSEAVKK